jgi:hypothetical protein
MKAAFGYAILEPVVWNVLVFLFDHRTASYVLDLVMILFPVAVVVLSVLTVVEINRHINHSERNDFNELKYR